MVCGVACVPLSTTPMSFSSLNLVCAFTPPPHSFLLGHDFPVLLSNAFVFPVVRLCISLARHTACYLFLFALLSGPGVWNRPLLCLFCDTRLSGMRRYFSWWTRRTC